MTDFPRLDGPTDTRAMRWLKAHRFELWLVALGVVLVALLVVL